MKNIKSKIKIGDYLYKLTYLTHPFRKYERNIRKLKIIKLNNLSVKLSDKTTVAYTVINDYFLDEWFLDEEKMYESKLLNIIQDNNDIIKEIKYLFKKIKPQSNKEKILLNFSKTMINKRSYKK